jgi:hypothetical protein
MAKSTIRWFIAREKHCLLVEKIWLIKQANRLWNKEVIVKNLAKYFSIYEFDQMVKVGRPKGT